jgi:uncharacterized protein (TIGR00255 family)
LSINSMTGYARLNGEQAGLSWVWEVKSVNGRGLELRTRLPNGFDFLDLPVRDAVGKRFKRGNISLTLNLTHKAQSGPLLVNEALLDQLVALTRRWKEKAPDLAPPSLDGLLSLRGVMESGDGVFGDSEDSELSASLLKGCEAALKQLAAMRADEGERLYKVLDGLLDEIAYLVNDAVQSAALDPAQLKAKLKTQVAQVLEAGANLSEERLAQEVALLLGKADVREELDRLSAHLTAARKMLDSAEPVGRKLDFLCQEFNREANTLCSKANDIAITRIGLALKAAIEQFREQVQNIE